MENTTNNKPFFYIHFPNGEVHEFHGKNEIELYIRALNFCIIREWPLEITKIMDKAGNVILDNPTFKVEASYRNVLG